MLKIRRLITRITTPEGVAGCDIKFVDGLNVIRADNSMGKSTCARLIVYALGMDHMFGPSRRPPLPPAVLSEIKFDETKSEVGVVSSVVFLTIENNTGHIVTIRRSIKSDEIDARLIRVWNGSYSSAANDDTVSTDYFILDPGSYASEKGFHKFLLSFLGYLVPDAIKYNGDRAPLYLECIFPLFYVDQRRGWAAVQATVPHHFQIRDAAKRALEYVLGLDAYDRYLRYEELTQLRQELKDAWTALFVEAKALASSRDLLLSNFPEKPAVDWQEKGTSELVVQLPAERVSVSSRIETLRSEMASRYDDRHTKTRDVGIEQERLSAALNILEEQNSLKVEVHQKIAITRREMMSIDKQMRALERELQRYRELSKLKKYGGDDEVGVPRSECPVCHQHVEDSLLTGESGVVMSIADNIAYIEMQRKAATSVKHGVVQHLRSLEATRDALERETAEVTQEVRALRRDVVSDDRVPSRESIRRSYVIENAISELESASGAFAGVLDRLKALTVSWIENKGELDRIDNILTNRDKKCLDSLSSRYRGILRALEFKSFTIDDGVVLSFENYHPSREGFDLSYDCSASDTIRSILAYLWCLLEASTLDARMRHIGLLILDEPRQQELKESSFRVFFRIAAESLDLGVQVIAFTSEESHNLTEMLAGLKVDIQDIKGRMIKLIDDQQEFDEDGLPSEEELIWESDAREAVRLVLRNAYWNYDDRTVTLYGDAGDVLAECKSYESLMAELSDIAEAEGRARMPHDSEGELEWHLDADGIAANELEKMEQRLKQIGWTE